MITAIEFLDSWNEILNLKTPKHHIEIINFLTDVYENSPHRGLLSAFRHSGKSTVVGIFATWVLLNNPASRIMIISAESLLASRMVQHIKHIMENHPACKEMLPKVKKEWASNKLTINRPIGIREPSVICQGIHGKYYRTAQ